MRPPPRKWAMKRDLTKANVSPFSGHSFHKRVTARVGRAAPPSSTQRHCGYPIRRVANPGLGAPIQHTPSPTPCKYPHHQSGCACQLPPPLGEEAFGVGFCCGGSVKLRWLFVFYGSRSPTTSSPNATSPNFSSQQPARTATIESDVKSLCPFSGRHKGRTV